MQRQKDWKEVKYFEHDTLESEKEFEKLQEAGLPSDSLTKQEDDEDEVMAYHKELLWKVNTKHEYQDLLAPFDNTEDFSTASILKNKGPNLTLENLSLLTIE